MYARLEVSLDVSDEHLRHVCRKQSAEYDWNVVRNVQRRIFDAEQFLLSQPKDLYGQQLSPRFLMTSSNNFH